MWIYLQTPMIKSYFIQNFYDKDNGLENIIRNRNFFYKSIEHRNIVTLNCRFLDRYAVPCYRYIALTLFKSFSVSTAILFPDKLQTLTVNPDSKKRNISISSIYSSGVFLGLLIKNLNVLMHTNKDTPAFYPQLGCQGFCSAESSFLTHKEDFL